LGGSQVEPVRFVVWSWPSDQIHGQVRDVRAKAARTNGEAFYLAWFMSQLDPGASANVLGYSFGARVATGALHLLGGGELAGRTLPTGPTPRVRVALLAAAVHSHWLQPGACHGAALSQMDRLLIQYNSCDPYLKHYQFIEKHARPAALGYLGMRADEAASVWLEQRDVCAIVGKSHAQIRYFTSCTLTREIRETFFAN
jgi:pimeloyl-ACP methyl ester carboxylesterase